MLDKLFEILNQSFRIRRRQRMATREGSLCCELLEVRQLLACTISGPDANGVLTIRGSAENDTVGLAVTNGMLRIDHKSGSEDRVRELVPIQSVKTILFYGLSGDDRLSNSYGNRTGENNPLPRIIANGGPGRDTILGGPQADLLFGGPGNYGDIIYGYSGNDEIHGGAGNDYLHAGPGNDRVYGEEGDFDRLYGEAGTDFLDAGSASPNEQIAAGYGSEPDFIAYKPAHARSDESRTADYSDLIQNNTIGNCSLLAAIGAVAKSGTVDLGSRIRYLGDNVFEVKLYAPGTSRLTSYQVTFNGVTNRADPIIKPGHEEFWPILYKRAFDQILSATGAKVVTIPNAFHALTGSHGRYARRDEFRIEDVKAALEAKRPIAYSTATSASLKLVSWHSYTVLRVNTRGQIVLYNPWGVDGGSMLSSVNDGEVTITFEEFRNSGLRYYVRS